MDIIFNPVIVSVVVLCVLCLLKLDVMFSLVLACFIGGLLGGMNIADIATTMLDGFSSNASAAMAYIFLGTFAACLTKTGLTGIFAKKVAQVARGNKLMLALIMCLVAVASATIIPVHIAFIPILIPPLLGVMNEMKMDRRLMSNFIIFGEMTYVGAPLGYGLIFMAIVADNMTANGTAVTTQDVIHVNWLLLVCFIPSLIWTWLRYRKDREYKNLEADLTEFDAVESTQLTYRHWVAIGAIAVITAVQWVTQSLTIAGLAGLLVLFVFRAIKWEDIQGCFDEGHRMMSQIAFIILVGGGFGQVMRATGGVDVLVERVAGGMADSHLLAAIVIVILGLFITMGIGTSFGTVPVVAVLFVPLCAKLGFSPAATILLLSSAGALGDAGSPASDATLGPTCGLNADGQHDHIYDTCLPSFLAFNVPLAIGTVIFAMLL